MPRELFDMQFNEVSIVDDPANDGARVVIVKAKPDHEEDEADDQDQADAADEQETDMDVVAIEAALNDAAKNVEESAAALTVEKRRADEAEAKVAELEKKLATLSETTTAETEEDVLKSLPEPIRKRLAAAEADIAKMREEAETAEAIAKAKSLGAADDEAAELGPVLRRIAKGMTTEEDAAKVEAIIKAAKAVAGQSGMFARIGQRGDNPAAEDPDAFYKSKAAKIREVNPALTEAQAYAQAMQQHPDVYARAVRG